MKYAVKHLMEYGALRVVCSLVNALPGRVALQLGVGLSRLAPLFMRKRIAAAHARIRQVCGGDLPDPEVQRIAHVALRNTFLNGVEILRMGHINRAWTDRYLSNPEVLVPLRDYVASPQHGGAILAAAHMGNWHLAAAVSSHYHVPTFFIVGDQKNPLTSAYINRKLQQAGGQSICRRSGSMRRVIQRLRAGDVLAITPDVRSRTPGVPIQFLDHPANLPSGMAAFAKQTGSPIFPAITLREGLTQHRWKLFDPVFPNPDVGKGADVQRMTQAVMDHFEREIRAHPEQYFWFNKRWILEPFPAGA